MRDVEDLHDPKSSKADRDDEQIRCIDEAIGEDRKAVSTAAPVDQSLCKTVGAARSRSSGSPHRGISDQLHFAPFIPPSNQAWESTSGGGFTHSAG